jgi:hypothetical protein
MEEEITLGQRLGRTVHVSPLRMKLIALWKNSPNPPRVVEDWLVDVANARGARIVTRSGGAALNPYWDKLTNEELVIGLILLQNRDRPQMLRLAAQLISRNSVTFVQLARIGLRERVGFILGELARQACKVERCHPLWSRVLKEFRDERAPVSSLLHYTRLAEPVMKNRRISDGKWCLVS